MAETVVSQKDLEEQAELLGTAEERMPPCRWWIRSDSPRKRCWVAVLILIFIILIVTAISLVFVLTFALSEPYISATLYYSATDEPHFSLQMGVEDDASGCAWAELENTTSLLATGWLRFYVESSQRNCPPEAQAFAAGFLEGALTYDAIWNRHQSLAPWLYDPAAGTTPSPEMTQWVGANLEWLRQRAAHCGNGTTAPERACRHLGYALAQFEGLVRGFQGAASSPARNLTRVQLYHLAATPDLVDAAAAMGLPFPRPTLRPRSRALVRLAPGVGECYLGYAAIRPYSDMLRVLKEVDLPLDGPAAHHRHSHPGDPLYNELHYPSYPGALGAGEDFVLLPSDDGLRLAAVRVPVDLYADDLRALVTPAGVPGWARATVASHLARSATEWVQYLGLTTPATGTAGGQWLVLDYSLVSGGRTGSPNATLLLAESLPGDFLAAGPVWEQMAGGPGYWPAVGMAYWPESQNRSGQAAMAARHGAPYTWAGAPLARIMARDVQPVANIQDMEEFLRSNDYAHDPIAEGDPRAGLFPRGDLAPGREPWGAIDGVLLSGELAKSSSFYAVSGPPANPGAGLAPFSWAVDWTPGPNFTDLAAHWAQPDRFDFRWLFVH
ncbi:putative lysosomal/endosomal membrane protein p67 [Paratrimastix pyriformis]|uniref:Phospholipase B-like n=1 Tax=Paratrimastix pyriformis TaxID=342808 RepID=A0ABQ8UTF2_9EUKA|nr:putative lysosomal/endosomal membrane protein p67 [Paratrimastix pyriformis]